MSEIRTNQRKAIESLIAGETIETAAMRADVTDRTIYNWLQDEGFKTAYEQAQRDKLSLVVISLSGAATEAVSVLRSIMCDGENPPATRVAAARSILENCIKMNELYALEQRVSALEKGQAS